MPRSSERPPRMRSLEVFFAWLNNIAELQSIDGYRAVSSRVTPSDGLPWLFSVETTEAFPLLALLPRLLNKRFRCWKTASYVEPR
jgi:hypothetical protein